MSLETKIKQAEALKIQSARLLDTDPITAFNIEAEYHKLRLEVINEVTADVKKQKSITLKQVREKVAKLPKVARRETGIHSLDKNLVTQKDFSHGAIGGFALGNFVQIAGAKGAGKSTFMMRILTNLSLHERVCWFDFEMGESRVVDKISEFELNDDNLLYYNFDRSLDAVMDEIKYLYATGVRHFVIDSTMKIEVKGMEQYERNREISARLSEITSTLNINIYIINQMSQSATAEVKLQIKHGNDAEYDADIILFILPYAKKDEKGKPIKDELGLPVMDDNNRYLVCTKNRQDERTFSVMIPKYEILGHNPMEIEFK